MRARDRPPAVRMAGPSQLPRIPVIRDGRGLRAGQPGTPDRRAGLPLTRAVAFAGRPVFPWLVRRRETPPGAGCVTSVLILGRAGAGCAMGLPSLPAPAQLDERLWRAAHRDRRRADRAPHSNSASGSDSRHEAGSASGVLNFLDLIEKEQHRLILPDPLLAWRDWSVADKCGLCCWCLAVVSSPDRCGGILGGSRAFQPGLAQTDDSGAVFLQLVRGRRG